MFKNLRMKKYIWLAIAVVSYWRGYVTYYGNRSEIVYVYAYAAVTALFFYLFVRQSRRERVLHIRFKKVDKMSGEAFEKYLKTLFELKGYRVQLTEASNDYGADLILKRLGKVTVVQAKRYDKPIGINAVQEAIGAVAYYEADRAMVVSNQTFTRNAQRLAEQNDVILWGREELLEIFGMER